MKKLIVTGPSPELIEHVRKKLLRVDSSSENVLYLSENKTIHNLGEDICMVVICGTQTISIPLLNALEHSKEILLYIITEREYPFTLDSRLTARANSIMSQKSFDRYYDFIYSIMKDPLLSALFQNGSSHLN